MVRLLGTKAGGMTILIDRAFARIDEGLVHYRHVLPTVPSAKPPLVMLHASPGSSRGLEELIAALAKLLPDRWIIAPDTLGNGDSAPPAPDAPDMAYFAGSLVRLLDALGVQRCALYGTHTGARTACEAGIAQPERFSHIVFDGIGDYSDEMRALLLAEYAPEVAPDEYGRHLIWAFNFVRDQALHYPYFLRDPAHRLMTRPVASPDDLHWRVVEVLKGITSYHKAYRAAFAYRARERLPSLRIAPHFLDNPQELPTLRAMVGDLAALAGGTIVECAATTAAKAEAIARIMAD
jgi:pimeloyl-ACP methyl ester carboxylesterase